MSDDIIRTWKNPDEPQKQPQPAPPNPAGAGELSDDALENVAGGGPCPDTEFLCIPPDTLPILPA